MHCEMQPNIVDGGPILFAPKFDQSEWSVTYCLLCYSLTSHFDPLSLFTPHSIIYSILSHHKILLFFSIPLMESTIN